MRSYSKGVKAAQKKRKEMAEAGISVKEKNPIEHLLLDPLSLRKSITAFCYNCMGGTEKEPPDANWRKEIKHCTSVGCPLMEVRPYQNIKD